MKTNLQNLTNNLTPYTSKFPDHIDSILQLERDFITELNRLKSEGQLLSIGIMGQVKAGKSSFLNALLFDGKPILPEAATPKTANLTRISHGEHPSLIVHYYTNEEWQSIEKDAASESEGTRARAARSLLQMIRDHGIDANTVLSRNTEEHSAKNIDELLGVLNDYVGEDGKYTALVKFTEIQLPLPELQGFEIIDTPGMNDPVPSRTQKTRDYMAECDVVFFLSRCSQFLDQSDMDLLANQLPSKGVKRVLLVAGQLDGVISDDGYDRASLAETEKNIYSRLTKRADEEIEKLAVLRERQNYNEIAQLLRTLKTPIFSSTFAHGYSNWDESRWGKSMRHMYEQLAYMADQEWNGYTFTKNDWERLGNFPSLLSAYEQARNDKEILLQARQDDLVPRNQAQLRTYLEELTEAVKVRMEQLKNEDIRSIESAAKACKLRISGISTKLKEIINEAVGQARKVEKDISNELAEKIHDAAFLETRTGQKKIKEKYYIKEPRKLTNFYGIFGRKTTTIEETSYESYEYLATADAIEQLINYTNESISTLSHSFNSIVKMSSLRVDLKRSLVEELSSHDLEFDPAAFRSILETTLNRLVLPELRLEIDNQEGTISKNFSGTVKSQKKMEALRQALQNTLLSVYEEISLSLKSSVKDFISNLEEVRDSLEESLTNNLRDELSRIKKDFANKENELKKYDQLLQICRNSSTLTLEKQ